MRELEGRLQRTCPFCRQTPLISYEEIKKNYVTRAEANDTRATTQLGGRCMLEGDDCAAFEYYTKAAGLGDIIAHHTLATIFYRGGQGVEKDKKKFFAPAAGHDWLMR
mmetsp:Transcript_12328/g.20310  ORF Transcript_12328/g.20310 Transcript_12328/m.20310 type:complete len:108 (-) Transcript_12328:54-377(-)|eukprot:scaffold1900_cov147-Skeletonema_menzelii.AAC.1